MRDAWLPIASVQRARSARNRRMRPYTGARSEAAVVHKNTNSKKGCLVLNGQAREMSTCTQDVHVHDMRENIARKKNAHRCFFGKTCCFSRLGALEWIVFHRCILAYFFFKTCSS